MIENIRAYPISDAQAEAQIVGNMLQSTILADEVLALVPLAALRTPLHQAVYRAISSLRSEHAPVDLLAVSRELRLASSLIGMPDLVSLARGAVDASASVTYHARHVLNCYQLQLLAEAADQMLTTAYSGMNADEALGQASGALQACMAVNNSNARLIELAESVGSVYQAQQSGATPGIPTGYADFDKLTGGWHPGDLNLLAARPGHGKTALALNFAVKVAEQNVPVFFSSLEMSHTQLTQRLLSRQARIDSQRIRLHTVPAHEMPTVQAAATELMRLPFTIYDKSAITTADLRTRVSIWRNRISGPAMVFVDYLQLMRGTERRQEGRVQEVGEISGMLKALARDLDVPILAMSQLNRAIEGRTGHAPLLSDLRESGNLEQDADMVLFIHREELYDSDTDRKGLADLVIAKQRNGAVGTVGLRFNPALSDFESLSFRSPEGY